MSKIAYKAIKEYPFMNHQLGDIFKKDAFSYGKYCVRHVGCAIMYSPHILKKYPEFFQKINL